MISNLRIVCKLFVLLIFLHERKMRNFSDYYFFIHYYFLYIYIFHIKDEGSQHRMMEEIEKDDMFLLDSR